MPLTGKQRSRRIDRRYYRSSDPYLRMKRLAGIAGCVVAIVYSMWLFSSAGVSHMSPGDLSQAHSAWNQRGCQECHAAGAVLRPDAVGGLSSRNVLAVNSQCNTKCHSVTDHFADSTKAEVLEKESCTLCHREHAGKEFSLVQLADSSCRRCHSNIEASTKEHAATSRGLASLNVTSFSDEKGHPSFKSLKLDPGTIKFSHIQHMRPGQPMTPNDRSAKSFGQIGAEFRQQYAGGAAFELDTLVQLDCRSCHEPDTDVPGLENQMTSDAIRSNLAFPSSSHRSYKPIDFKKHCVACHDLDGVTHGLNREQTAQSAAKLIPFRQWELLRSRSQEASTATLNEDDLKQREMRLMQLLTDESSCQKCHSLAPKESIHIVQPSQIPSLWLKAAEFPHGQHLMMHCQECHPQPFAKASTATIDSKAEAAVVMIRDIESCRQCHIGDASRRANQSAKGKKFVASADCVDCHRYHTDPPKGTLNKDNADSTARALEQLRHFLSQRSSK
jgi:Class III cytochrome C family